uniref:TlmVIII n=1 Tax=Streptoalloteichus hindustanus TaxID=2017 RepID=A4KUB0_STRHI|nr:TlmVIII [Streptoalloteichus hindustanus]
MSDDAPEPIAIVSLAGRFPGADDVPTFWENLRAGEESIRRYTREELLALGRDPALVDHPRFVGAEGVLGDIAGFDADFFGYSPREAEIMDPQHRLCLETAWAAFDSAGYDPAALTEPVGVFLATSLSSYLVRNLLSDPGLARGIGGFPLLIHNDKDFAATTVSHKLGLTGPSYAVGSACSSSLVAVHLACQSLQSHECDMALAGGVSLQVPQGQGYVYAEDGIYSPDGRCAAFDASAGGTVGGSGVGLVLLKRLSDAVRDRDQVHALVLGTAVNNDGANKVGYTAPSVDGQSAVIVEAHAVAGISADTVGYVEAHGTGTSLGDPIEVTALTQAFRASTDRTGFCALGSVKTNIGHLDAAAGIAGLVKAALAVRDGIIPASLNFREPNPRINFAATPFHVADTTRPWRAEGAPRRAGVSSFGIGGTNVHVVLEQPPAPPLRAKRRRAAQPLVLSARTGEALAEAARDLAERLRRDPGVDLADVAATLASRRAFPHRKTVVCRDVSSAISALDLPNAPARVADAERPVVFLFPGQGAAYPGMARELAREDVTFRAHLDECADLLAGLGVELDAALDCPPGTVEATRLGQPALFAVEYALARALQDWGLTPTAMLGHSLGEYVAATLAGVLSLPDALRLVSARGRVQAAMAPGRMLAVSLPEDRLRPLLASGLSVSAVNASDRCVVGGEPSAVADLAKALGGQGIPTQMLPTAHAFHSTAVEPVLDRFREVLAEVEFRAPSARYASNLTGNWVRPEEACDPDYWLAHMRQPVRFGDGLARCLELGPVSLVEVGPSAGLTGLVRRHPLASGDHRAVRTIPGARDSGEKSEVDSVVTAVAELWAEGCAVRWDAFHRQQEPRRVAVPAYPFQRERYWVEPAATTSGGSDLAAPVASRPEGTGDRDWPEKRPDIGSWGYRPGWRHAPTPVPDREAVAGRCLLFSSGPLGHAVERRLVAAGVDVERVPADPAICFDPDRPEHYRELVAGRGGAPRLVVHLWALEDALARGGAAPSGLMPEVQRRGLHSLLHLARALGAAENGGPTRLVAVTGGAQEVLGDDLRHPEHATALAAVKIIPREYPGMACTAVDLDLTRLDRDLDWLAERVVDELLAARESTVVAYRGRRRFRLDHAPCPLEPGDPAVGPRPGGVYLVCGGLGGIGLNLAEDLGRLPAKVVLTHRRPFPAAEDWADHLATHPADDPTSVAINRLRGIIEAGGEVLVAPADLTDSDAVRAVVAEAERRFGPLTGAVHAAGVPDTAGVIHRRTTADTEAAIAAKVHGTAVLDEVLGDRPLDFFVLCSSIGSVLHKLKFGEVGYVAGNDYLNAYAAYRAARRPGITTAIAWTDWLESGMSAVAQERLVDRYDTGGTQSTVDSASVGPAGDLLGALTRDEGVEVFRRVLRAGLGPQVLVSTQDLDALLARHDAYTTGDHLAVVSGLSAHGGRSRARLSTAYAAPRSDLERTLAGWYAELLGYDQIGRDDDFFELGGDSLLALRLRSMVRSGYGVEVSVAQLFDAPTVTGLATLVGHAVGGDPDRQEVVL